MKKIKSLLATVSLCATMTCFAEDKVLATYNDKKVTEAEVMTQIKEAFKNQPALQNKKFNELDKKMQTDIVRGYVGGKLLQEEAKKSGFDTTPEFQAKLENVKQQLMQQELLDRQIKQKVTDAQIDEEYKKFADDMKGKDEIKVSHIVVETQEKGKEVKAKLNKGSKFADLAKQYSKDESSKAMGGTLGYFTKGQIVPVIEEKAFAMKVGEISEPIKTDFGWHIIKVEDKRKVKVPSKEEAKNMISVKLSKQVIEAYIEDLINKANTKILIN
jgi:peptidylprolyl isomerase/peptidyl-prolyl cis-trans isomerase C